MKRGFQGIWPCEIFSSIFEKVDRSKFRKKNFQKSGKKSKGALWLLIKHWGVAHCLIKQ